MRRLPRRFPSRSLALSRETSRTSKRSAKACSNIGSMGSRLSSVFRSGRRPADRVADGWYETASAKRHRYGERTLDRLQTAQAAASVMETDMAVTKSFKELVQSRVAK